MLRDVTFEVGDRLPVERLRSLQADLTGASPEAADAAEQTIARLADAFAEHIRRRLAAGEAPTTVGHTRPLIHLGTVEAPFAGVAFANALASALGRRIAVTMGTATTRLEICPPENGG